MSDNKNKILNVKKIEFISLCRVKNMLAGQTFCVVLDQSTVIFQKRGGGDYNLCGIEIKIVAMLCFISWLFAEYVPMGGILGGFQSPLVTNKTR